MLNYVYTKKGGSECECIILNFVYKLSYIVTILYINSLLVAPLQHVFWYVLC